MKAIAVTLAAGAMSLIAGQAQAGRAFQHSGQAIQASADAVGYTFVGTTQLVSGVLAVPFKVAGSLTGVSQEVGDALSEAANAPLAGPLPIAEESITAGPPPLEALVGGERRP